MEEGEDEDENNPKKFHDDCDDNAAGDYVITTKFLLTIPNGHL